MKYIEYDGSHTRHQKFGLVSEAFSGIVKKNFNKNSIAFDILTYGNRTECIDVLLRNVLQKSHFAVKVIKVSRDR